MGITHRRYSGSPGIGLPRWATHSLYVDPTPSFPAGTGRIALVPITYGRPHKWAVGHTFEFSFSLPEPANKGGCPPKKKNPAGTGKTLKKATPRATNTKQRTAPDPAQAKAKRQKQVEYDRQRSQSPGCGGGSPQQPGDGRAEHQRHRRGRGGPHVGRRRRGRVGQRRLHPPVAGRETLHGTVLRRDGQDWSGLVSGLVCPPIPLASCYLDLCLSGEAWEGALHSTTSRTVSEGGGGGEGTVGLDWMAGTYRTIGRGLRPVVRVRAPCPTLRWTPWPRTIQRQRPARRPG